MNKNLDAFNTIVGMFNKYANKPNDIGEFFKFTTACQKVEKALKALEIIKKKGIDTSAFNNLHDYDEYLEYCESSETFKNLFEYTKEEFDLIKEELK